MGQDGLTYPVHVWKDAEAQLLRTDTYGGVNSLIILKVRSLAAHKCLCLHCWNCWGLAFVQPSLAPAGAASAKR